jgi:hypothetical protein
MLSTATLISALFFSFIVFRDITLINSNFLWLYAKRTRVYVGMSFINSPFPEDAAFLNVTPCSLPDK